MANKKFSEHYEENLLDTASQLLDDGLMYVHWEDKAYLQMMQKVCLKNRIISCLQILTSIEGTDAQEIVDYIFDSKEIMDHDFYSTPQFPYSMKSKCIYRALRQRKNKLEKEKNV